MNGVIHTRALRGTRLAILIAAGLVALCLPFSGAFGQRPHDSHSAPAPHNSQPQNSAPHNSASAPAASTTIFEAPGRQVRRIAAKSAVSSVSTAVGATLSTPVGFSISQQPRGPTAADESSIRSAGELSQRSCSLPGPGLSPSRSGLPASWKLEQHATRLRTAWLWSDGQRPATFFTATPFAAGICSSRPPGRMA